ncbi:MAG: hypothetical protein IKO87_05150 [Kiritimatiellae bacterium]|nr:hypothetical protein [Kiritimatiellia bacterium]MBR4476906.1 hypothetical protein [Kiritimatiellia bacterium]
MAQFLRVLVGLALLPACWAFARSLVHGVMVAAGGAAFSVEAISLLAGMAAFALCWATISHPVRMYVLGHELTHALWGLLFGARPSDVRVSESGGSVKLTKSNMLITLAPYFFPFYTFVVIIAALVTFAFLRPLPFLPLWMFLIGFTWAFHLLFTLETLTQRQPDVKLYGRIFSWAFIFLVNVALVLIWLAATTPLTFAQLGGILVERVFSAYIAVGLFAWRGCLWLWKLCTGR